jgi:hypothetical protein
MYNSLIYANEQRWTNTRKGLLGGKVLQLDNTTHSLVLKDFQKRIWNVDFSQAEVRPKTRIAPGRFLKITGVITGKGTFHALSIQNWEKKYNKRKSVRPEKVPVIINTDMKVI